MIKPSDVILAGLMIAAAVWTFQVKHETVKSAGNVRSLQKHIAREKARIDLLEADWAVLTQPSSLQEMAKRFADQLQLQPLNVEQIIEPDNLPPIRLPDDPIGALARGDGASDIVTGSIKEPKK
jgi:hypothetical protein